MKALSQEIEYLQEETFKCFESVIDNEIDKDNNSFMKFDKCKETKSKLEDFYTSYWNKSEYSKLDSQSYFNDKVDESYLLLGRFGYDSNLCRSL